MIRVKICGMQSPADIETSVAAGADAVGFIFCDGPRRLTLDDAAALTSRVPPFVTTVGVFADTPISLIREALARCRLDVLQFAGNEEPQLRGSFARPTLIVSRGEIPELADLRAARAIAVVGDGSAGDLRGGTGVRMSIEAARGLRERCARHFILAGGLTPDNVAEAIRAIEPDGVDVRSGVERDGRKDAGLIRAFVRAVKEARA
jgi:phosphoribosylanthranilate isomerase